MNIAETIASLDPAHITIGVLGGHSALDVCEGAKRMGFKTLAVCQRGREQTYAKYFKTRENRGCIDHIILVDSFKDIVSPEVQEELRKQNTIFILSRYFWVYCDFNQIENDFSVPIYGTRHMVRLEERDVPQNQYWLLEKAGIRLPRLYDSPDQIDQPVIVKVNEATRTYERAFFVATSPEEYQEKSAAMLAAGTITEEGLKKAVIEEFIIGAQVNFNFFYSVVNNELELMGTDARRQTSLDGFLRLDAGTQLELLKSGYRPSMIETGHFSVTTKESILEKAFEAGEKFVQTTKEYSDPGIIGPFALQGAVAADKGKEEIVIFDVSMRIPGSPGTRFTPHTTYLWGRPVSYGERIAMEIRAAIEKNLLSQILT
ncbi:formate--phosphoribosylaminoimidazolecarboxamide ligase family protein [Patescibacteria group bacterium]|nr:formate--phosphoribosylaminoimidazolecarboxamide ligase family protein [Patescibacteria group bacterium]